MGHTKVFANLDQVGTLKCIAQLIKKALGDRRTLASWSLPHVVTYSCGMVYYCIGNKRLCNKPLGLDLGRSGVKVRPESGTSPKLNHVPCYQRLLEKKNIKSLFITVQVILLSMTLI